MIRLGQSRLVDLFGVLGKRKRRSQSWQVVKLRARWLGLGVEDSLGCVETSWRFWKSGGLLVVGAPALVGGQGSLLSRGFLDDESLLPVPLILRRELPARDQLPRLPLEPVGRPSWPKLLDSKLHYNSDQCGAKAA